MKYLVLSDIHGNYDALKKVVSNEPYISLYLFLGDIVGYGPEPEKCIQWAKSQNGAFLVGNHDLAFLESISMDRFSEKSKKLLKDITISEDSFTFLSALKNAGKINSIGMVHGSPIDPTWAYILTKEDAFKSFLAVKTSLTFFGHTHLPAIYLKKGSNVEHIIPKINKEYSIKGELALVNPGSVGQPRDLDNRSSYIVYDSEKKSIIFKRSVYNIKRVQKKIRKLGYPDFFADRLSIGE